MRASIRECVPNVRPLISLDVSQCETNCERTNAGASGANDSRCCKDAQCCAPRDEERKQGMPELFWNELWQICWPVGTI